MYKKKKTKPNARKMNRISLTPARSRFRENKNTRLRLIVSRLGCAIIARGKEKTTIVKGTQKSDSKFGSKLVFYLRIGFIFYYRRNSV